MKTARTILIAVMAAVLLTGCGIGYMAHGWGPGYRDRWAYDADRGDYDPRPWFGGGYGCRFAPAPAPADDEYGDW